MITEKEFDLIKQDETWWFNYVGDKVRIKRYDNDRNVVLEYPSGGTNITTKWMMLKYATLIKDVN